MYMSEFKLKKDRKVKKKEVFKSIEELHSEKISYFKKLKDGYNEELDYFCDVGDILKEYYELDEMNNFVDIENLNRKKTRKRELTEMYYDALNVFYVKERVLISLCKYCKTEMFVTSEKFLTCRECGFTEREMIVDGTSYQDEIDNKVFVYDYKRINYFTEWLNQIQAKETATIPTDVIEKLQLEIKKKRITKEKMTMQKMKKILKESNNSKYYEHIPLIISNIYNCSFLSIPEEICEKLKAMFLTIQQPFELLKGARINFFSYPYIIYKFCEILGLREYLQHFSLLKSREKLMKQDELWKKIVENVRENTNDDMWVFIPSC